MVRPSKLITQLFLIVGLSALFVFTTKIVYAANTPTIPLPLTPNQKQTSASGYSLICMKMDTTYKPMCHADYPNSCTPFPAGVPHPDPLHQDFEGRITGSGFPTDTDIYIVGCVSTHDNFKCTAGSEVLDARVRALGFQLEKDPTQQFAVSGPNPRRASPGGSLEVIIRSQPPNIVNGDIFSWENPMAFYGIFSLPATVNSGDASTLQYGTFDFNQDASKCVSIHWDPEGRVFDSKSLEPLPNSSVQLLNDKKTSATGIPGLNPSITTGGNGEFSFYVPAGTYYMHPTRPGYTFPVSQSSLNPNYRRIYSCDRSAINDYSIYSQEYPLVEKNGLIHCDIPLDPGINQPRYTDPILLSYGYSAIPRTTITKFTGSVSLPLTKIELVGETDGKVFAQTVADKVGGWEITLSNNKLPQNEALTVRLTRPDFNSLKTTRLMDKIVAILSHIFISTPVFAQQPTMATKPAVFEPILRYIEGYAYDASGKIMPNTTVVVVLQMSNKTEYKTITDSNGFFIITPEHLPIFAYHLEFIPQGSSVPYKVATSNFVRLNEGYLSQNKLNLLTATRDNQVIGVINQTIGNSSTKNVSGRVMPTKGASQKSTNESAAKLFVILAFLLIASSVGFFLYLKKKKSAQLPFSSQTDSQSGI